MHPVKPTLPKSTLQGITCTHTDNKSQQQKSNKIMKNVNYNNNLLTSSGQKMYWTYLFYGFWDQHGAKMNGSYWQISVLHPQNKKEPNLPESSADSRGMSPIAVWSYD